MTSGRIALRAATKGAAPGVVFWPKVTRFYSGGTVRTIRGSISAECADWRPHGGAQERTEMVHVIEVRRDAPGYKPGVVRVFVRKHHNDACALVRRLHARAAKGGAS